MSYVANQYNYATPLSSIVDLTGEPVPALDKKYFSLSDNILDGSYYPISGSVGLWGTSISDADGNLVEPLVLTVTEELEIRAFRLCGSVHNYPVAFTVKFYNGSTTLHTITETANTFAEYLNYLPSTLFVTSYEVTITKISKARSVARLYNLYNPIYLKRTTAVQLALAESASAGECVLKSKAITLQPTSIESRSSIVNTMHNATDSLLISTPSYSTPTNVHTKMKEPHRRVYGKVLITYTDPMLNSSTLVSTSDEAYNSDAQQVLNGAVETEANYFTLYDNDLTGDYVVIGEYNEVGWTSKALSGSNGKFAEAPRITVSFSARPIVGLRIRFNYLHGNLVENFVAVLTKSDGSTVEYSFSDNTSTDVLVTEDNVSEVVSVTVIVFKVSKPYSPASILEIPVTSTLLYKGYTDASDIMSIDLLEELTYEDDVEALGGVSANEITVTLNNSDKSFYFNSTRSLVAKQLKRNRKIVPWLGVEVIPGSIEWYELGTFWSYDWDVPVGGLTAKVIGFDTIGLLGNTDYTNHTVQVNKSLGALIEYVLDDAKKLLDFIEYRIDPALYSIIIPYAWFDATNHAAALRRISGCYPMHIYCDRKGTICAAPQKLHLEYFHDVWSGSTNVIGNPVYNSLYTALPNIVNVNVLHPVERYEDTLAQDIVELVVDGSYERVLNFTEPYLSDLSVTVDCDSSVNYTYEAYSWGISFTFTGRGVVRSIICGGTCVDTSHSDVVTKRDSESVRVNGSITRKIESDFIQTRQLADSIIDRLFSLSENDKYDVTVEYRGDIALSINDPIVLIDGIAPDNRYNIRRHRLTWNGALRGTADLNT